MKPIVLLLALSLATPGFAAVYKTVRPDGTVVYSDQPPTEQAAPLNLPQLQLIPGENLAAPPTPRDRGINEEAPAELYRSLAIVEPEPDGTVRDTTGRVPVRIDLDPPLITKEGDYLILYLDGQPVAEGSTPQFTLEDVDRGTHRLEAAVSSAAGQTLIRSPAVTFHLHRTSVNLPARR